MQDVATVPTPVVEFASPEQGLLPLVEWRDEAETFFETVSQHLPPVSRRPIVEFFRSSPPPDGDTLVLSHNDLGIEHVLVDDSATTVTGVIDLGPAALDAARRGYPEEAGLRDRAWFIARCSVFEDLAYGVETRDRRYVDKNVEAIGWLFQ
jgi:hypothetical protein